MSTSDGVFAKLPVELILRIFHLAAASSKICCLDLCLVSSWTRELAEPYLFKFAVMLDDDYTATTFFRNFDREVSKGYAEHIHTMSIPRLQQPYTIADIISPCPNLKYLVLPGIVFAPLLVVSGTTVQDTSRQDIHLTVFDSWGFKWTQVVKAASTPEWLRPSVLYQLVTHIRFNEFSTDGLKILLLSSPFTRLTHFSMPFTYLNQFRSALEESSRCLKMFVIVFEDEEALFSHRVVEWLWWARNRDTRVHITVMDQDLAEEWREEVEGGESIWEKAVVRTQQWEARVLAQADSYQVS